MKRERIWLSEEAKRIFKIEATKKGMNLAEYMDYLAGKGKNDRKGLHDMGFFK